MTPRPLATLSGPDARVFDLVAQVAAIVERHGIGTAADVVRIATAHLRHPRILEREATAQKRRAEAAEAEVQRLREKIRRLEHGQPQTVTGEVWTPPTTRHHRVAELSRLTATVLYRACGGHTPDEIGAQLGLSRRAVLNHLARAAHAMDADHAQHAISLASRRVVEIRVKSRRAA